MWLDLRKASFHAQKQQGKLSSSNDSCMHYCIAQKFGRGKVWWIWRIVHECQTKTIQISTHNQQPIGWCINSPNFLLPNAQKESIYPCKTFLQLWQLTNHAGIGVTVAQTALLWLVSEGLVRHPQMLRWSLNVSISPWPPDSWLRSLAIDSTALCDMWSWKWHQWMPYGCFSVDIVFACHFVAPHHLNPIGVLVVLITPVKTIKKGRQFS